MTNANSCLFYFRWLFTSHSSTRASPSRHTRPSARSPRRQSAAPAHGPAHDAPRGCRRRWGQRLQPQAAVLRGGDGADSLPQRRGVLRHRTQQRPPGHRMQVWGLGDGSCLKLREVVNGSCVRKLLKEVAEGCVRRRKRSCLKRL